MNDLRYFLKLSFIPAINYDEIFLVGKVSCCNIIILFNGSYKYKNRCITIGHKSLTWLIHPHVKNIPERNIPKEDPLPDPTKLQFE